MTTIDKLDEFAKAALTGLLSDPGSYFTTKALAEKAYQIAEAMAEERERVLERRRTSARSTLGSTQPARPDRRPCFTDGE